MNTTSLSSELKRTLSLLPKDPGVYRFYDQEGDLLYVGKALVLRNRVRSYFQKSDQKSSKTHKLVTKIHHIEYTITRSEGEALVLEANLIHQHKPPFNILLRDDKHFLYLQITRDPFPRILFTRKLQKDGSHFFGPFAKASHIRKIVDFLQELFLFRTCAVGISPTGEVTKNPENRKIPCLEYQIDRCSAPCDAQISLEEYQYGIDQCLAFFRGKTGGVRKKITEKMNALVQDKKFEKAIRFRDLLGYIESIDAKQVAEVPSDFCADAIGFFYGKEKSFFHVLSIRSGRILRSQSFSLLTGESEEETFLAFLRDQVLLFPDIGDILLVPEAFPKEHRELWEYYYRQQSGKKITIRLPERGVGRDLLDLAQKNASLQAVNSRASFEKRDVLQLLQDSLSLPRRPERIECYDISHLSGTHPVGSQVVFLEGKPATHEYRKYKIKTLSEGKIDDFAALSEVLFRRLSRLTSFHTLSLTEETEEDAHLSLESFLLKQESYFHKNPPLASGKKEETKQEEPSSPTLLGKIYRQYALFDKEQRVATLQIRKVGAGLVCLAPRYENGFENTHEPLSTILQALLLQSDVGMIRFCILKHSLRIQLSLESIGFREDDRPPKALLHISETHMLLKAQGKSLRKSANKIPDLLVIDGGKGQLSSVVKVLKSLPLQQDIPVCSLAKREEEIFIPGRSTPLHIPKTAPENQLLQNIRDEAHRCAISFHKYLRNKEGIRSSLDTLLGPHHPEKNILLETFGNVENILSASKEQLQEVVGEECVQRIIEKKS